MARRTDKAAGLRSLADGRNILEIAYYGPGAHGDLRVGIGRYRFRKEVLVPFGDRYTADKTVAVIVYDVKGATMRHFGIGDTADEAVRSALTTLIAKYEPLVFCAEKALESMEPTG